MVGLKLSALVILAILALQTASENKEGDDDDYYDTIYYEESYSTDADNSESSNEDNSESYDGEDSEGLNNLLPIRCKCENSSCTCCGRLDVIGVINENVCITFTYTGERTELRVTIKISDRVVFDQAISAHNPPPICVSHPAVQILADVCFDFHDIQVKRDKINVCLRITPRILFQPVTHFEIGCFTLSR